MIYLEKGLKEKDHRVSPKNRTCKKKELKLEKKLCQRPLKVFYQLYYFILRRNIFNVTLL